MKNKKNDDLYYILLHIERMGIDNESKLILGICFGYDDFNINLLKTILKPFFSDIDDDQIIIELLGVYFFHLSYDIIEGMSLEELLMFLASIDNSVLKTVCNDLQLTYSEPGLYSCPHIW